MWLGFESTAVNIHVLKHWIHSIIDKICLGVDLAEAFELSSSDMAVVVPSWSGSSLASLMKCPNVIFLASFPGMEVKSFTNCEAGGQKPVYVVDQQWGRWV